MAGTEDEKGEEEEEGRGIMEETSTTGRAGNIRANVAALTMYFRGEFVPVSIHSYGEKCHRLCCFALTEPAQLLLASERGTEMCEVVIVNGADQVLSYISESPMVLSSQVQH